MALRCVLWFVFKRICELLNFSGLFWTGTQKMSMPQFSNWVVYFKSVDVTMYKDNVTANWSLIDLMNWFSCSLIAHIITAFHIIVCSFLTHRSKIKRKGWLAGWCVGELISAVFFLPISLVLFPSFLFDWREKETPSGCLESHLQNQMCQN